MASRTLKTSLLFSLSTLGEHEVDIEITYSVTPGCVEQGPSYACGGQPAEDAQIEIEKIVVIDPRGPFDITWMIEAGFYAESDFEQMIGEDMAGEAEDAAEARAEYRAEQRADDRMMGNWS